MKINRHFWARTFLAIGIFAWLPYMIQKYILFSPVSVAPYLTIHLLGVIPGSLLRRGPETVEFFKQRFQKGTRDE